MVFLSNFFNIFFNIKFMDLDIKCHNNILNFINENDKVIRKRKYDNKHYLDNFLLIIDDVVKWKSLRFFNKNLPKYHYKTIENKFRKLCKNEVFKKLFYEFLTEYYDVDTRKNIIAFIDTTFINNSQGNNDIDYNPLCPEKRLLKYIPL